MPFKSKAQAHWMFLKKPKMAKEWAAHTKSIKSLPEKVTKKKSMKKKVAKKSAPKKVAKKAKKK